uniref:Uncharacterized protein n=1 Tax=Aegilops tauschii subsp. strangulata TaxID=200361 RepID=A0A453D7L5_AEGTS
MSFGVLTANKTLVSSLVLVRNGEQLLNLVFFVCSYFS